jgi:hypothetical protein
VWDAPLAVPSPARYHRQVQDHLDLQGASGASYRFSLIVAPDQLPASCGDGSWSRAPNQTSLLEQTDLAAKAQKSAYKPR